jgi:peptidoglycan/xylan/chitin deacetylase (PgdA/CDA1 family)
MLPIIPFQIVVGGRTAGGSYLLRAAAAGRTAEATLELPPLRGGPEELGPRLGRALFPPALRRLLVDTARGADAAGARVQLQLQIAPPEVAAAPWEWLTLGSTEIWQPAVRDDYPLVRIGWRVRPTPAVGVDGPLRMLIAAAPGAEPAVAVLGHALAEAVRSEALVVDLLRDATPEDLRDALAEEPCNLLHLIAPVEVRPRGVPQLGLGRGLDAAGLADLLSNRPELRLISIADPNGDEEAVAHLAHAVHEVAERATIALGGLAAAQAATFCGSCYTALAAGDPVDLAVTDGRAALAGAGAAWGVPQLRIAAGGEQLFRPQPSAELRREAPVQAAPLGEPVVPARRPERPAPPRPITGTFAMRSTTVGEPMRRPPRAPIARTLPGMRLVALFAASLLLIYMVILVNRNPAPTPVHALGTADGLIAVEAAALAPALPLATEPLQLPVAEVIPLAQQQAAAAVRADLQRGPLRAPAPQSHAAYVTVEGDTLASIAERAGSDPLAIAAYNRIDPFAPLRVGRPLVVPIYSPAEDLPPAPMIARGNPAQPRVALTFDIEIDDVSLYSILDALDGRGVKGTFFVVGRWVQAFPDAARAIVERGHEIANHSFSHPSFAAISVEAAVAELERTEQIVRATTGATTRPYFRFPYGDAPPATVEALGRQGYHSYFWSIDDNGMPAWVAQAAADPSAAYGGIVLIHGRADTTAALPGWLDQLIAAGLEPTTLSATLE